MTKTQAYMDKYQFTVAENKRFTRTNFTKLVHTNARFEGVNTTLPQTQTIMDGMSVAGVPVEDILTIVNLVSLELFLNFFPLLELMSSFYPHMSCVVAQ